MSTPVVERYHWFGPASVEKLRAQLNAGPVARLEVRGDGEQMTLTVVYVADEAAPIALDGGPVNESFPCPPRCP